MTLMRFGTTILRAPSGELAGSSFCCCNYQQCCGCDWLYSYWQAGLIDPNTYRIKLSFSGSALTGDIYLLATDQESGCMAWINDTGGLSTLTDNCDFAIGAGAVARLICNGQTLADMEIQIDIGTGNCTTTAFVAVSQSCGPDLSLVFNAVTVDVVPGGCTCGEDIDIDVTVTNADPPP